MRIVIDLQGAQRELLSGEVKEHFLPWAKSIVGNKGDKTVILTLSALFPETIEPLRNAFSELLSPQEIRIWEAPAPVRDSLPGNTWRREAAERIREAFLASLEPDVIFVPDFFIGYHEEGVTSIGHFKNRAPTVVALLERSPLSPLRELTEMDAVHACFLKRKLSCIQRAARVIVPSPEYISSFSKALSVPGNLLEPLSASEDSGCRSKAGVFPESWGRKTLDIFEQVRSEAAEATICAAYPPKKPTLAYVSPLPHVESGVAAYSAGLLRRLGDFYDITVVVEQESVSDTWIQLFCSIRDAQWLEEHHKDMDRVLYHFGNSPVHLFMFPLLEKIPGVVFLHDFALGGLLGYRDHFGHIPFGGTKDVYLSHGYKALQGKFRTEELDFVGKYPINFSVIQNALGVIVHSEESKQRMRNLYGAANDAICEYIPIAEAMGASQPKGCPPKSVRAIEKWYAPNGRNLQDLMIAVKTEIDTPHNADDLVDFARAVSGTFPRRTAGKQLLVDVSVICRDDFKTGIQRVVRALLLALLDSPPEGYRIEPVYLFNEGVRWHYRYARRFTTNLLECPSEIMTDEVAEIANGDILFCPDLAVDMTIEASKDALYRQLRNRGVKVFFMLHDILPITMPHFFEEGVGEAHAKWLKTIVGMDGCICVSKATADELRSWMEQHAPGRLDSLRIEWSHHGADLDRSAPTTGLPEDAGIVLAELKKRTTFLMVGTVEPRKGHRQTLDAFTELWKENTECNLVIVGKTGWMMESLIEIIQCHEEREKRLFWLQHISDEYLEKVYNSSTCLLFASEGEGFGLPLIEAAKHGLPIIAREIPVFREVAGPYAFYFSGTGGNDLAAAVKKWMKLYNRNEHPNSDAMPCLTWKESAEKIKSIVLKQ
jgi:glycosyltransferase involved in cell wall biosynthesis